MRKLMLAAVLIAGCNGAKPAIDRTSPLSPSQEAVAVAPDGTRDTVVPAIGEDGQVVLVDVGARILVDAGEAKGPDDLVPRVLVRARPESVWSDRPLGTGTVHLKMLRGTLNPR